MSTIYDFSRQIKEYCKAKNYVQALEYFKANKVNFEKKVISGNQFLIGDILACLRHTNHFDAGFQFLHNYEVEIDDQTPEVILNAYAWLLYDNFKFENNGTKIDEPEDFIFEMSEENTNVDLKTDKSELISKIEAAMQLLVAYDSIYSKNVLEFLFKIVLKVEKNKLSPDWTFVVSLCDSIDPKKLSTTCATIKVTRKGVLKDMELASAHESWYAYLSKGLFETKNYQRCFDISKLALDTFDVFHYSNDIWFARRIALCKKALGNIDEAISELEAILIKKKEWFIRKELAEMYLEKGNLDKAFTHAMQGMVAYGDLEYKVELIELLAGLLKNKNENILAHKHYVLVSLIREEEKWRISHSLLETINSFNSTKIYKLSDKKELVAELELFWKKENPQQKSHKSVDLSQKALTIKQKGTIKRLLIAKDTGRDGFITKENGDEVYFFLHKDNNHYNLLKVGINIEFETIQSTNGKGDKAIKIVVV